MERKKRRPREDAWAVVLVVSWRPSSPARADDCAKWRAWVLVVWVRATKVRMERPSSSCTIVRVRVTRVLCVCGVVVREGMIMGMDV